MARQCMRPGCDRPVAARLTYDTVACAVWLDGPVVDDQPSQQVCSVHAATLTAPLGWTVTDRRLTSVTAEAPGAAATPAVLRAVPDRAGPGEPVAGEPVAADAVVGDQAAGAAGSGDQPAAKVVRRPRADAKRPKLLDRAFEWTGPQHSVLTQKPGDEPPDEG